MRTAADIMLKWIAVLVVLAALRCPAWGAEHTSALKVDDIVCRGNLTTSCKFIRGHLFLRAGQSLDENEIGNATLRLSWLPNFRSVAIHLEKGAERGRVIVVIEVVEADPIATAFSAGLSFRSGSQTGTVSGRIGDHNLFGTGKSLDLILAGEQPIAGLTARESLARLEYTDPQLFGSSRNFLFAGAFHLDSAYRYANGDSFRSEVSGFDLSVGQSFGRFSYFTIGYEHLPQSSFFSATRHANGNFSTHYDTPRNVLLLGYGWNSQDDPSFPTRGTRLSLYNVVGESLGDPFFGGSEFRATWGVGARSFLTLGLRIEPVRQDRASIEGDALMSLSFSRDLPLDGLFAGVRRGRWYFEPGITPSDYSDDGHRLTEVGAKLGVRLQTRSFGLVNLYIIGTGLAQTGHRSH
jgi:outer membrane protein assembly factor BamA